MSKKMKIAYFVMMAITGTLCVVDIIAGKYVWAAFNGINLVWLINAYFMERDLLEAYAGIQLLLKELHESAKRESIRQQEFNKMRERAQNAEKQLQQMIDDTPARGKDGRYIKREVE